MSSSLKFEKNRNKQLLFTVVYYTLGEDGDADNSGDDSNNGDLEEDTDEFETASPEAESGEDEMYGVTSMNEGDGGW